MKTKRMIIGITKDKEYRKQQLKQLKLFLQTHERELYDTVYKDLHKHPLETMSGEIAPILSDIDFMLKVILSNMHKYIMNLIEYPSHIRTLINYVNPLA